VHLAILYRLKSVMQHKRQASRNESVGGEEILTKNHQKCNVLRRKHPTADVQLNISPNEIVVGDIVACYLSKYELVEPQLGD